MSIYIPELYHQLPVDICNHIMKYIGKSPTTKLIEVKCNNYKQYESRFGKYLQTVICKKGFYSYMKFKQNKLLTRKQQFDLIFANWLYENHHENVNRFIDYYNEYSILYTIEEESVNLGGIMVTFIAGNTLKFIICHIFCEYINEYISCYIKSCKYNNLLFDFDDLLQMATEYPLFIEKQLMFFRNCEFDKIYEMTFVEFLDENTTD